MAWHNGVWWPLYTPAWFSPKVSQFMFDPYSFTHLLHGFIFQLILGRFLSFFHGGFLICILLELSWEVLENSELVMKKFRENSGTSGQYKGDSVQNIIGDVVACGSGFVMGNVFHSHGVWWLSLVWIGVSEVSCGLF